MYIRSIITLQKAKRKICLGDGADFVLYKKEVTQYGLQEDMELSQELYDQILAEVLIPRAKKRAMYLLEKMDRSKMQLRGKLKDNGYPEEAIEEALAYVESFHYIDDERLARSYIRFYQESRSQMRITQDLLKKGISKDIIALALEEEFQNNEQDMIISLMKKKNYNPASATREEQAKMYRFLAGRGFKSADISRALHLDNL